MTHPDAPGTDRVAEALSGWLDELAATGGPTGLLHCPDGGSGALELTTAHPSGLAQLLAGRPARLSSLVRETAAFADARRRAREVHIRAEELREQRGLESAHLAVGIATWTPAGSSGALPVRAPVLLRRCGLRPVGVAHDDYEIHLTAGVVLNPVLAALAAERGVTLDGTAIAASAVGGRGFDPVPAYSTLGSRLGRVPGFRIDRRLLLGTFADPATAAARDVAQLTPRLRAHPVLTALLADPAAAADEAAAPPPPGREPATAGEDLPALLLDLDPDQREAVERALAGTSLSVDAPAGTGATQVAAALAATLAARGRHVLLLADAAAELRDVAARIATSGAGPLVLHVRDAAAGDDAEQQLVAAAARVRTPVPDAAPAGGAAAAEQHGAVLDEHVRAEHRPRDPWGVSASAAREALAELAERPLGPRTTRRLRGAALARCRREELPAWAARLGEAAELGAFSVTAATTPWAGAGLTTDEHAAAVAGSVRRLVEELLPTARARMAVLAEQAGLRGADTVADWLDQLRLLRGVRSSVERFGPDVYRQSLADVALATARAEHRREQGVRLGWWRRWQLRRQARALLAPGVVPADGDELHTWLQEARAQRLEWQRASGRGGSPHLPAELPDAETALDALVAELDAVAQVLPEERCGGVPGVRVLPLPQLSALLRALHEDTAALQPLPRRTVLLAELAEAGWQPLLEDVGARWNGPGSVDLLAEVETAWWAGVLEAVSLADPLVGAVDAAQLRQVRAEYALCDRAAAAAAAAQVRAAVDGRAGQVLGAGAEWPEPTGRVSRAVPPRSVADVLRAAGERAAAVLPCWAMSPLSVAEALPADVTADVLIVLGAEGTGLPAVLPAIARARQLVVLGDRSALPPLSFATVASAPPGAVPAQGGAVDTGRAGVPAGTTSLAALAAAALPEVRLRTQHTCRSERLLRPLLAGTDQTVLPGAGPAEVLRVVDVAGPAAGRRGSQALVEAVAELVVDHVRRWPQESLGVVAADVELARVLDEVVRRRVAEALGVPVRTPVGQEVVPPWPLPGMEPLYVAEVERWRATRRDAVVLAVPAGAAAAEAADSSPLAAGPLGLQRVTLALSRGRSRVSVVAEELPATAAAAAAGERLLREGLAQWRRCAADSRPAGGAPVGALARRLAAACGELGMPVVVGAGTGRPVDVLVGEPEPVGGAGAGGTGWRRGVLAVELDGPGWAAVPSTRERERGRPEELERAGWRYARCLGSDVLADADAEARRLAQLWREHVGETVWEVGR